MNQLVQLGREIDTLILQDDYNSAIDLIDSDLNSTTFSFYAKNMLASPFILSKIDDDHCEILYKRIFPDQIIANFCNIPKESWSLSDWQNASLLVSIYTAYSYIHRCISFNKSCYAKMMTFLSDDEIKEYRKKISDFRALIASRFTQLQINLDFKCYTSPFDFECVSRMNLVKDNLCGKIPIFNYLYDFQPDRTYFTWDIYNANTLNKFFEAQPQAAYVFNTNFQKIVSKNLAYPDFQALLNLACQTEYLISNNEFLNSLKFAILQHNHLLFSFKVFSNKVHKTFEDLILEMAFEGGKEPGVAEAAYYLYFATDEDKKSAKEYFNSLELKCIG
jgi:hypothetical protein